MIAGAGHPRADEPRNRSGDGAAAQRPAAARRPVAPGREGDRRRRLLGAERGLGTAFWRVLLPSSLRRCFASVSSLVDWKSK